MNTSINSSTENVLPYKNFTSSLKSELSDSLQGLLYLSSIDIREWSPMNQGALVVVLDMSLAIISVVFNLMVITSVKEKEEMLGISFNLVLMNLCSSNLLSCVIVKSISIVHNAYAVAANSTQSDIAFCILYSFGFRLTWSVLPWSIVVLSWLTVLPRIRRFQVNYDLENYKDKM